MRDLNFQSCRELPNENGLVYSWAGKVQSIQADRDALDPVAMPYEGAQYIARAQLPQLDRLITGCSKDFIP